MFSEGLCFEELVYAVYGEVARQRGAQVRGGRDAHSMKTHHLTDRHIVSEYMAGKVTLPRTPIFILIKNITLACTFKMPQS